MQNYMVLDRRTIQTPYGILGGVDSFTCHPKGELLGVKLSEKNMIVTQAGEMIPAYTEHARRKNKPSVEFDKQGMVISVALEKQQEVLTPIGELPAELVKFYSTGELHRVFILDGQLSGFWSEEDEKKLNISLTFDLGFAEFQGMINGICFYKSGDIKSITLFPGEVAKILTPMGMVETKVGVSLYESGNLKSVEPADPVLLPTPIGRLTAYDPDQNGINADRNSLSFTENGEIKSLITCDHSIYVQTDDEEMKKYSPHVKVHPLYDELLAVSGIQIEFLMETGEVMIDHDKYDLELCGFTIEPFVRPGLHCSPSDCANCSLCNKSMTE
jgi:hypothetical protein